MEEHDNNIIHKIKSEKSQSFSIRCNHDNVLSKYIPDTSVCNIFMWIGKFIDLYLTNGEIGVSIRIFDTITLPSLDIQQNSPRVPREDK